MATAWTLLSQEVITDALQICGQLGAGQTASPDDYDICLTALQNILKEMPLHGLSWSKITAAPVALVWSVGTPSQIALPTDYYGAPNVFYTVNGANVDLEVISKAAYDAISSPAAVALHPEQIYIAANNTAYLWPVPSADPGLSMTYQAVTLDADYSVTPDIAQSWLGGIGLWIAYEVCPKFGVDMASRQDIERRFLMRRRLMVSYSAETAPICFGVAD